MNFKKKKSKLETKGFQIRQAGELKLIRGLEIGIWHFFLGDA
jgi:hypothetical protein